MQLDFVSLIRNLDQTNKTNQKVAVLSAYFTSANPNEVVHAIAILSGNRPKRIYTSTQLRMLLGEITQLPDWLLEETWHVVGDLAETLAKCLPEPKEAVSFDLVETLKQLRSIRTSEEETKKAYLLHMWQSLDAESRFIFNKLITGHFRIGVSRLLIARALSVSTGIPQDELLHRLMGRWDAFEMTLEALIQPETGMAKAAKPYPFFLASPLEGNPESLGSAALWQAEWKWDGIRGQLVLRDGQWFLWSRGEELLTEQFPEFESIRGCLLDGIVLDGELLVVVNNEVQPFQKLQPRISRKRLTKKILNEAPVVFRAYDLLEFEGRDLRKEPLTFRRSLLTEVVEIAQCVQLQLSENIRFDSWSDLAEIRLKARENMAEGLMLKKLDSPYETGRKRGSWWKWKVAPLTIDAVLIYAMRGHGRRANLYTDYTFAVWDELGNLVPVAKAYSGLTDVEFQEVDRFVKQHTLERFGPVRSVVPELVFELAFEGIQISNRHKSGVALRFPRMHRWRRDKLASEANTLFDLKKMI